MDEMKIIDVKPFIDGWKMAAEKNLNEARALMSSSDETLYNRGVLKENVASLVLGFSNDLMNAPTIDPESLRKKSKWMLHESCSVYGSECSYWCKNCKEHIPETFLYPFGTVCKPLRYCPYCGAKME